MIRAVGHAGSADRAGPRREVVITTASFLATLAMTGMVTTQFIMGAVEAANDGAIQLALEYVAYGAIVDFLLYGSVVYQLTRLGHLQRSAAHRPVPRKELDRVFVEADAPAVVILVPSYKEDPRLVRQTLLSAALQEYPNRRVVLLIDDPPAPQDEVAEQTLQAARRVPEQVADLLATPARKLAAERYLFSAALKAGLVESSAETVRLASLYRWAADWLHRLAARERLTDHTDRFFVEQVLCARAADHHVRAERLLSRPPLDVDDLEREYARIGALFNVQVTSFERKRWMNLSHEPNKAANLNSYIGLLGGSFSRMATPEGWVLQPRGRGEGDMHVPDAEFLVTLDADSLLLPYYVTCLLREMRRPGGQRIAVAQTPYSAVPNPATTLERVAGATTDVMHIIHQGSTLFDATFWVGANALVRTAALRDIAQADIERGHRILRYIQDRTVIEDTESTIDLTARGWKLYNYPDRLAYSATPADYGALLIQRRRWANGGLIILPKLLRAALTGAGRLRRLPETALRLHYLMSITGANIGLLLLLTYPFSSVRVPLWLPLTAIPYYALYARDLRQQGYRLTEVVNVYALNLLLMPVNLGGVLKSVQQAVSRRKIPFGRTPKVADRTPAPALYVVATWALLAYWAAAAAADAIFGRVWFAVFSSANVALLGYAVTLFMGWRAGMGDVTRTLRGTSEATTSRSSEGLLYDAVTLSERRRAAA